MNKINDFKLASFDRKCDFITQDADFISSRSQDDLKIYLYHTKTFFIEVQYSVTFKKVVSIQAFNNISGLEPYAEEVSLNDLTLE